MNEKLATYLENVRAEIRAGAEREEHERRAEKEREKGELLFRLGLTEEIKTYVDLSGQTPPSTDTFLMGRNWVHTEEVDGERRYYTTRNMPIEITDEEYEELKATLRQRDQMNAPKAAPDARMAGPAAQAPKQEEEYAVSTVATQPSRAADFLKLLAYATMVLGTILAIVTSFHEVVETTGKKVTTRNVFSFTSFLTTEIMYLLIGAMLLCMVELFENIQSINNSLTGMRIRRKQ